MGENSNIERPPNINYSVINLEYHPQDSRIKIADDDIAQTLSGRMGTGGVTSQSSLKYITLTEKRFFKWVEDDKSVTIRNRSGSYGGGSEVLVIELSEDNWDNIGEQPSR